MTSCRTRELSRYFLIPLALFGTLAVLCALAVADGMFFLAGLLGIGAVFTDGQHDTAQAKAADLSAQRVR